MDKEFENIHHPKMNAIYFILVDILHREPHLHFDTELLYVLDGKCTVKTLENAYTVRQGQGMVFNSCQTHEIIADKPVKLLIMQLNPTAFNSILPQMEKLSFDSKPFDLLHNDNFREHLTRAAELYFGDLAIEGTQLRVFAETFLAFNELLKTCPHYVQSQAQRDKSTDLQERIQRISSYIEDHFTDKLSLDELADREGFSRTYFSHFFKTHFGITFKEYLDNIRCEMARRLLLESSENLLTITYECGFSDIRTLNNAFKRHYGLTPRDFRKVKTEENTASAVSLTTPEPTSWAEQNIYADADAHSFLQATHTL